MPLGGSSRKCLIDGISFDIAADNSTDKMPSAYELENLPTSGANLTKATKRSQNIEGLELVVDQQDVELVVELTQSTIVGPVPAPVSLTYANGKTYSSVVYVNYQSFSSDEMKLTVDFLPIEGAKPWVLTA